MNSHTNLKTGAAICALLAVVDIVGLAGSGMDDAPPFFVIAIAAVLGLATLAALRPALRQATGGLWTVIISRVLSALWGLPVYFADEAPFWAKVATTVAIALTVLGVGLLAPAVRQRAVRTA
jgi:FtsH-binding integral membrane protein